MPRVQYIGDYDAVDLVIDGKEQTVEKGKQIDVPAAIRDELIERDDWSEVKDPGGAKAKAQKENS